MKRQSLEVAGVGLGATYLAALAWAMSNLSFDIWGALLLAPIYGILGVIMLRRMFRHGLQPIAVILSWGMGLKLLGAFSRYWVGFEAYGGGIDAGRYHDYARFKAAEIWSGERPWSDAIPTGTGTDFVDEFTGLVYTLTGGSQLAGFVTFSFLAFIGTAFFVKAAAIAVPGLAVKKYTWLCVLAPSLVYWPSSIGKEAIVLLGLGIGTYGIAALLSGRRWTGGALVLVLGLGFTGIIRPHMAGIWLAATLPALTLTMIRGGRTAAGERSRPVTFLVLGAAGAGFAAIAKFTVAFLQPDSDDSGSQSLTQILEETARRTSQAGSNFSPPSITNPVNWPYAVIRTLTRPLPIEASGVAQLVSAAEMLAFAMLLVWSWRRVRQLPHLLVTNPYVLFVVSALVLSGLAYTSLANLGVLTRQKSLLFPLLLLLVCLPKPGREHGDESTERSLAIGRSRLAPLQPLRVSTPVDEHGASISEAADLEDFWSERIR